MTQHPAFDTILDECDAFNAANVSLVLPSALLVIASIVAGEVGCDVPQLLTRLVLKEAEARHMPALMDGDGREAIDHLAAISALRHRPKGGGDD